MADTPLTGLTNITGAAVADADEFYVADQDGAAGPAPASRAITRAELRVAVGLQQVKLSESPITPDNTVAEYIFDVGDYAQVEILWDGLGFAASDRPFFELSIDGGTSYKNGASDYFAIGLGIDGEAPFANNGAQIATSPTGTSGLHGQAIFRNLRAGRFSGETIHSDGDSGAGSVARMRYHFANFDGPVTHIKIFAGSGNNMNAGTIRAMGLKIK